MLRYEIEAEGYYAVVNRYIEKFTYYLTPTDTKDPPLGTPAMSLTYFPFNFSNKYPVLAVSELAPEFGRPAQSGRDGRPNQGMKGSRISAINIGLRIYALSLTPRDGEKKYEDGRATAGDVTRAVWSNWLSAFEADQKLRPYNITLNTDLGDLNNAGGYLRQPDAPENILWVRASTLRIET